MKREFEYIDYLERERLARLENRAAKLDRMLSGITPRQTPEDHDASERGHARGRRVQRGPGRDRGYPRTAEPGAAEPSAAQPRATEAETVEADTGDGETRYRDSGDGETRYRDSGYGGRQYDRPGRRGAGYDQGELDQPAFGTGDPGASDVGRRRARTGQRGSGTGNPGPRARHIAPESGQFWREPGTSGVHARRRGEAEPQSEGRHREPDRGRHGAAARGAGHSAAQTGYGSRPGFYDAQAGHRRPDGAYLEEERGHGGSDDTYVDTDAGFSETQAGYGDRPDGYDDPDEVYRDPDDGLREADDGYQGADDGYHEPGDSYHETGDSYHEADDGYHAAGLAYVGADGYHAAGSGYRDAAAYHAVGPPGYGAEFANGRAHGYGPTAGLGQPDERTEVLINRGRRHARPTGLRRWTKHWRAITVGAAGVMAGAIAIALVVSGSSPSWPASVAVVQREISAACQNPNVVSEPSQVNFACAKDSSQILWVFSLLTSDDNPKFSDRANGRQGLEPITPSQGGDVAWSLNLHHPYNPANPTDSLAVAARAINDIIGGATLTGGNGAPEVQPGLESNPANCERYTGSSAIVTHQGFPAICAQPVTSPGGEAALVSDVFKQWMLGTPARLADDAGVLFENADNPGNPQVQAILNSLSQSRL
jgi:hypothetical protein